MKPDHSRVKTMLKDTITLLCKNGLPFKQKFNVEAIIGVTLDDDEVVLLSINEVIRNTVDPEISDDPVSETDSIPNQKHKRKRRRRSSAEKSSPEKQAHMESSDAGQEQFLVVKRENDHSADLQQENYEASQALPQDVNIKQEKSEVICLEEDDDDDDESSESPMYEAYEVGQPGQAQGLGFAGSYGVDGQGFRGDMSWGEASTSSATGNLSQPHNTVWFDSIQNAGSSTSNLTCTFCHRKLQSKEAITVHRNRGTGMNKYSCQECSPSFKCSFCDKFLRSKAALIVHENSHRGIYKYSCQECRKGFYSLADLNSHMSARHNLDADAQLKFQCSFCSKGYCYKSALVAHMKQKHEEKALTSLT